MAFGLLENSSGDEWNQKSWEDLVLKVKWTIKIKSYNLFANSYKGLNCH